jgi:two-component system sensor histidine kinase BaeS
MGRHNRQHGHGWERQLEEWEAWARRNPEHQKCWQAMRKHFEMNRRIWGWDTPWKPRGWGLRRRMTVFFAVVALAAVGLTTWLTLGAALRAQQQVAEVLITRPGIEAPFVLPNDPNIPRPLEPKGDRAWGWWWDGHNFPRWNEPAFAPARSAFADLTRNALLAGLLSFVLATVAASIFTRRITRPLGALSDGARRLAAGERGIQLKVPKARDELQAVTLAFNHLVTGLERQEAWRRGMVADIAHDLRTPLSVLRSEIEAMQDGVSQPDQQGLDRLHAEVLLMARLVDDLRTLSLAEGGNLNLRLERTELQPFLSRTLESFSARAAQGGVNLRLEAVSDGLSATFDREQIMRVLQNLLENAVRHAGPGTVEVSARPDGEFVALTVRDHGPGLQPEDVERVFERFYQTDASRTRAHDGSKGSGLGLAIVKAIAEAHGGRIAASNHPDEGAVFTLRLPISPRVPPNQA